jgi:hypothetical protein
MKAKWRWVVAALVPVVTILVLTVGRRVESYSCAECRNCKKVDTRSIAGIDLEPRVSIEEIYPLPSSHIHRWWQYASYRQIGVGGVLAKHVECEPFRYQDGRGPEALAVRP